MFGILTTENILKCAKLKIRINELQKKRKLNLKRFESYAEKKEKEIDELEHELEHELRKSNQEMEFMRYTTKQRNNEFMSNTNPEMFTQNIQLNQWLSTATSNLHKISNEVRETKQQFDDYKKQAAEINSVLIGSQQKKALENEQLRLQLAEALRSQQSDKWVMLFHKKTTEKPMYSSLNINLL